MARLSAAEQILSASADKAVPAGAADQGVIATAANEQVVAAAAVKEDRQDRASNQLRSRRCHRRHTPRFVRWG